jgi:hypothetical protein
LTPRLDEALALALALALAAVLALALLLTALKEVVLVGTELRALPTALSGEDLELVRACERCGEFRRILRTPLGCTYGSVNGETPSTAKGERVRLCLLRAAIGEFEGCGESGDVTETDRGLAQGETMISCAFLKVFLLVGESEAGGRRKVRLFAWRPVSCGKSSVEMVRDSFGRLGEAFCCGGEGEGAEEVPSVGLGLSMEGASGYGDVEGWWKASFVIPASCMMSPARPERVGS